MNCGDFVLIFIIRIFLGLYFWNFRHNINMKLPVDKHRIECNVTINVIGQYNSGSRGPNLHLFGSLHSKLIRILVFMTLNADWTEKKENRNWKHSKRKMRPQRYCKTQYLYCYWNLLNRFIYECKSWTNFILC